MELGVVGILMLQSDDVEDKGCAIMDSGATVMCSSTLAAGEIQVQRLHQSMELRRSPVLLRGALRKDGKHLDEKDLEQIPGKEAGGSEEKGGRNTESGRGCGGRRGKEAENREQQQQGVRGRQGVRGTIIEEG